MVQSHCSVRSYQHVFVFWFRTLFFLFHKDTSYVSRAHCVMPNASYHNTKNDLPACILMKPNSHYQNTKHIGTQMYPDELHILHSYVAYNDSMDQSYLGNNFVCVDEIY